MTSPHNTIRFFTVFLSLIFLAQCSSSSKVTIPEVGESFCTDRDGDTYAGFYTRDESDTDADIAALTLVTCTTPYDCNDDPNDSTAASIFPGAVEIGDNGIDEDCDAADFSTGIETGVEETATTTAITTTNTCADESAQITYYQDLDGDGYGNSTITQVACSRPSGYATLSTDCNDNNSDVHPGATETPDDGIDQECDGGDSTAVCDNPKTYFLDNDKDGYRGATYVSSCFRPADNYYTNVAGDPYYAASEVDTCGTDGDSNKYQNPGMGGKDYGYLVYQADPNATFTRIVNPSTIITSSGVSAFSGTNSSGTNNGVSQIVPSPHSVASNTGFIIAGYESTFTNSNGLPQPNDGEGVITRYFLNVDNDCDSKIDENSTHPSYDNSRSDPLAANVIDDYISTSGIYYNVCDGTGAFSYYNDADNDTYGDEDDDANYTCRGENESNEVINNDDCDDSNSLVSPSQTSDYANHYGLTADYSGIDNDCDGNQDEDGLLTSNQWLTSVAFNGVRYNNAGRNSDKKTGFSSRIDAASFFGSSVTPPSAMLFESTTDLYNDNKDFNYKIYHNSIRANKDVVRFWYNSITLSTNDFTSYDDSNGSYMIQNDDDYKCDDYNSCTGKATVLVTGADAVKYNYNTSNGVSYSHYNDNISKEFLEGKKVAIFLRGVQVNGSDEEFRDAQFTVSVDQSTVTDEYPDFITINYTVDYNGPNIYSFSATLDFTLMVYDENYVKVIEYATTNNDSDFDEGQDNDQYFNQETTVNFDLLNFTQPSDFDCPEESDCTGDARTVGSVLQGWGFDLNESLQTSKIKGMSYAKKWEKIDADSANVTLKTKGTVYDAEKGTNLPPNRMKSSIIVCSNSNICMFNFTKTEGTEMTYQPFWHTIDW